MTDPDVDSGSVFDLDNAVRPARHELLSSTYVLSAIAIVTVLSVVAVLGFLLNG